VSLHTAPQPPAADRPTVLADLDALSARLSLEEKGGLFEEVFGLRPVLVEPAAS